MKGFTLIELLVVVLIIGILAAVAVPQYELAVFKSRTSELFLNVKTLSQAAEACYLATGSYCTDFTMLDVSFPGTLGECDSNGPNSSLTLPNGNLLALDIKEDKNIYGRLEKGNHYVLIRRSVDPNSGTYWDGAFTCWADETDAFVNRVCKSLGGTLAGSYLARNVYRID